jgi:hypothetical protein
MSNERTTNGQFGYTPVTPNIKNQMNTNVYNNFQKAFTPNTPLIDAPDYSNRKQVIHDNLGDKLLSERVVEYRAIMHSKDRDRKKFPSPFNMRVSFGNTNTEPHITEAMTNVKYVTLNNVWVPRTVAIDTSKICAKNKLFDICPLAHHHNDDPESDAHLYSLGLKPYLLLRVRELDDKHLMGTSPIFERDTFMIVPDQKVGDTYIFKPKRSTIVYPNSLLKNLSMFTLQLLDDEGNELYVCDQNGKKIVNQYIHNDVECDYNEYVDKHCCNNKHVKHTDHSMQVIYDFTFGVIENELNTLTNYNKI